MANSQFIIKVSDLLHTPGSKDAILLESKESSLLPYPSPSGISAEIEMTGMNDVQLIVEWRDIEATLELSCSRCGEVFQKDFVVAEAETKWLVVKKKDPDIWLDPDIIPIDPKHYSMDLEQWLVDTILLSMDVQQLCEDCQNKQIDEYEDESDSAPIIWKKVS